MRLIPVFALLLPISSAAPPQPLFAQRCAVCHGGEGGGSDRGPALAGNRRVRSRSTADIENIIRKGTPGGMPGFALPETQVTQLASYVRSLNATAFETQHEGDVAAGERFFRGAGRCSSCHDRTGPDLSNIARQLTLHELEQSLDDPSARIAPGYGVVDVVLNNGQTLRGFARSRGSHDLQLQLLTGEFRLLIDREYREIKSEPMSLMPALRATPAERRDLLAYLSRLGGVTPGPIMDRSSATPNAFDAILHPRPGDWPTYYGNLFGNRYSTLDQIDTHNAGRLQLQWIFPIQYQPLETRRSLWAGSCT